MMELCYGYEKVTLELPASVPRTVLQMPRLEPLPDPAAAMKEALQNPIGSVPLKEYVEPGDRVCFLVNDSTRVARSEYFLPILVDELKEAGAKEADMFIVFTNGTHRPLSQEEMTELVGEDIARRITLINHDCHDNEQLISMGETSRGTPLQVNSLVARADKRILTGSIVYHFFAGFGGGRKALIPGVAGYDTIRANHSMMMDPQARLGQLEGNPVHEDQLEAAKKVGGGFLFNVVLDEEKNFLGVFAGDMERAHLAGCDLVRKAYGVAVEEPADVVIASCGGHPKDVNLYQAQKTLENAVQAVKPGGQVILLACCPEGIGSEVYEEWARRHESLVDIEKALKANFQLGGHKAFAVARAMERGRVFLVSGLAPEAVSSLGFVPAGSLREAVEAVYGRRDDLVTYIIPQGSLLVPMLK